MQISDDHIVQKKMLTTLWTMRREDFLLLLQMYLPPTENFVHAAVQHIRQAMPRVEVTMDTRLFVSALAPEDELWQLWKTGEAATEGLAAGERAPPCGSAKAGAAATGGLEDGERAPPGAGPAVQKRHGRRRRRVSMTASWRRPVA